jgi:glycosyltransferase involved in cell wall biosynthesis/ubiquinone/menaquinone biosynthesis C-methylase UbiE
MDSCLYVAPNLGAVAVVSEPGLGDTTERHRFDIRLGPLNTCLDPLEQLMARPDLLGAMIGMERGWPGGSHLRFAKSVLARGKRVWLHYPAEGAIECLDVEAIRTYWQLWLLATAHRVRQRITGVVTPQEPVVVSDVAEECEAALRKLGADTRPAAMAPLADGRVRGTGLYLRTDYWNQITSGGSYGHTCYVARELAAASDGMVCLMGSHYALVDEFGLTQVVMPKASASAAELPILAANWHYLPLVKFACQLLRPAYIYERLCLGNFVGAMVSRELGIPYILEYNGSEVSMNKSFNGTNLRYEELFVRAEEVAFKQATMISVVSKVIKESLVKRGIDPAKILVNPNGADTDAYQPASREEKAAIRRSIGFHESDRVVGFTGTFGGWHGIDVLAEAVPSICAADERIKFLLIGDGSHKAIVDRAVSEHHLESRVYSAGRVPQQEGARLLKACDVFVSPHSSHMHDSKFFGSPTKLFEYMAVGEGIVASDLEQLGEVLSPALRPADLSSPSVRVTDQRAVLCQPGNVAEFTAGVIALAQRPDVAQALGRNARQSVIDQFSWHQHVAQTLSFGAGLTDDMLNPPSIVRDRVSTGDAYKEEVQDQWNENPVGTQYAKTTTPYSLAWFREIEAHRYGVYAPWMPEVMEFDQHANEDVLEIGAGVGTDLSQFAKHGARVTDLDLSAGHLEHAKLNFSLRGLTGRFVHHDAEALPFDDNSFDVVYSNGVLHHTPHTHRVVDEIHRVLRPGGKAIIMMYATYSLHYWWFLVYKLGLEKAMLQHWSIGEIMSRRVEMTQNDARPLVKVYSASRLKRMFAKFEDRRVYKRQLMRDELPESLRWLPLAAAGRWMGWNVIIKARKPQGRS